MNFLAQFNFTKQVDYTVPVGDGIGDGTSADIQVDWGDIWFRTEPSLFDASRPQNAKLDINLMNHGWGHNDGWLIMPREDLIYFQISFDDNYMDTLIFNVLYNINSYTVKRQGVFPRHYEWPSPQLPIPFVPSSNVCDLMKTAEKSTGRQTTTTLFSSTVIIAQPDLPQGGPGFRPALQILITSYGTVP